MITGIIGGIMALVFMVLLLVPIPMFNCSLGKESYISLIAWIVIGVVFYFRQRRKKGHDDKRRVKMRGYTPTEAEALFVVSGLRQFKKR